MGTTANLELRIGTDTLFASTTYDGYWAYMIVPRFVEYLNSAAVTTREQDREWFRAVSKELFPHHYSDSERPVGGFPCCEVIIDTERKLVLHTGDSSEGGDLEIVSNGFPEIFKRACTALRRRHNYQVLKYEQPGLREVKKEAARIVKKPREGRA